MLSYYCLKCKTYHHYGSKIEKQHRKYAQKPSPIPTGIRHLPPKKGKWL